MTGSLHFLRSLAAAVIGLLLVPSAGAGSAAAVEQSASAPGAIVYFHGLRDGTRLPQRFRVRIGLKEMGVAPAGVKFAGTGHHHVLVDVDQIKFDEPLPADFNHVHLGNGQTEVELSLTPGPHTLQLVLADERHVPHRPPVVSRKIRITVE